ncbi:MAG: energy transducer TonB [Ferruginibacter sp.]
MEKNNILNADILDIIFDGKNKLYGAYDLRKTYNKRMVKSVFVTVVLVLFAFLGSVYSNMTGRNANDLVEVEDIVMSDVKKNEPLVPPPPPVKPPPPLQQPNQKRFVTPIVVNNQDVPPDEEIKDLLDDQLISDKTIVSDIKASVVQAPVEEGTSKVFEAPKADDEGKIFLTVQNEAQFPGGPQAWARYLQKNLNGNVPVENNAPNGTYRIIVRFIVSKDGSISDVNAETKFGFGMEDEAVKIIKRGPKWIPAMQNDRNVNAYRRQPVTFLVNEQE